MGAWLVLLVLVGSVALAVAARTGARPRVAAPGRLREVDRATRRWRASGLMAGAVVAAVVAGQGSLGHGALLAAPLAALCVLLGVVAGELRVPAPAGGTRSAAVEVRRARDYLPPRLTAVVASTTGLLLAVLAFTTAVGSADDLGRAGRSLARQCADGGLATRGPWPGSSYGVPLLAVLAVGLAVAAVAVHRVVRRPRQGEDPVADDALRRAAATSVTAAVGLLVAVPAAGVSLFAASGLLGICAAPAAWSVLGAALLAGVPLLVGLSTWCAVLLVLPARPAVVVPAGA